MSVSGFKKLYARYRCMGKSALVHGLLGKSPNRKPSPEKEMVLRLVSEKYKNFNISHACEMPEQNEGVKTNPETLRLWLVAKGKPVAKRKTRHRIRREPKQHFGELLQIDGSFHDWLNTGKRLCMINIIDDATNTCMLHFDEQETIESACHCLWRWIRTHGVPKSIYADGRNMYHPEPGREHNFFTNMCRRLGIETIRAHSAQAKGRVERANATHQNRLVPTLEFHGIKTAEALNEYICEYEQSHNRRFSHPAPG